MNLTLREQLSSIRRLLPKYRVITYIDGFNLYFGIRREAIDAGSPDEPDPGWYSLLWLDLHKLCMRILTDEQELVAIKYFTAPITGSKGKQERQNAFLDALRTLPKLEITFGRFEPDRKECRNCGHLAYHPQEKKTDVNIATALICDAIEDEYDTAIVITGDSDLVPALQAVRRLKPNKRLIVAFPPKRYSKELEDVANGKPIHIWKRLLKKSRLPQTIKRDNLPDITCPDKYSGKNGCTKNARRDEIDVA